ncbi:MAG: 3-dehydroquinate synthase [Eubacterium sp.]|nr:3-dehydroquinate synthase [Eubacterium sp.]
MTDHLTVNLNNIPVYDITYNDSFDGLSSFLKGFNASDKKALIISDSKVASLYLDAILNVMEPYCKYVTSFVFPAGESSKTLDTVRNCYEKLILEKFDRHDFIVALGGGVTGDMAGYTAATFLRGIDFIQIPTSLLADVDSSIGGKTGVDFDAYKNMVGAFHMPQLVYINRETFKTLDKDQYFSGMGEVVKSALIRDSELFTILEEYKEDLFNVDRNTLMDIVYRCNLVKKAVVEEDPEEKGIRAILNYGHTLGHALEKYMNFKLLHGECVSIGSIMASYISLKKGFITKNDLNRIIAVITRFDLPKLPKDLDVKQIIELTKNDKKMVGNTVKFILLRSIGEAFISREVSDEDMMDAIEFYLNEINDEIE